MKGSVLSLSIIAFFTSVGAQAGWTLINCVADSSKYALVVTQSNCSGKSICEIPANCLYEYTVTVTDDYAKHESKVNKMGAYDVMPIPPASPGTKTVAYNSWIASHATCATVQGKCPSYDACVADTSVQAQYDFQVNPSTSAGTVNAGSGAK